MAEDSGGSSGWCFRERAEIDVLAFWHLVDEMVMSILTLRDDGYRCGN